MRFLILAACCGISWAVLSAADEAKPKAAPTFEELKKLAEPGPEHESLASLAGTWKVEQRMPPAQPKLRLEGTATVAPILKNRFLEIDATIPGEQGSDLRYMLGFDRRTGEYTIVAFDTQGTYFVTGAGKPGDDGILMSGEDDKDPVMKQMGFRKKYAFELKLAGPDQFSIVIHFVDTRTAEEKRIPFAEYAFTRAAP